DTMLVHAVLEAPEPPRRTAEHGGGLVDLRDVDVLASHAAPGRMPPARQLNHALALARRSVAVLREQGDPVTRRGCHGDQRVTAHGVRPRAGGGHCQARSRDALIAW